MKVHNIVSPLLLAISLNASADEISDKIKAGMSKVEVSYVMGNTAPDSEECTTVLGVSKCTLTWKKGVIYKTAYIVSMVADKVIAVTVQTSKIFGV